MTDHKIPYQEFVKHCNSLIKGNLARFCDTGQVGQIVSKQDHLNEGAGCSISFVPFNKDEVTFNWDERITIGAHKFNPVNCNAYREHGKVCHAHACGNLGPDCGYWQRDLFE